MEINLTGAVLAVLLIGLMASILCIGLLALLHRFKMIRFHEKSGIIAYGIIGGIVLTIIVFKKI